MIVVELLLKVVLIYVCNVLKLKNLRIVYTFRVHPAYLSLDLLKPIFIVSSHNVFVPKTNADIGLSTLVVLLTRGLKIPKAAYVL